MVLEFGNRCAKCGVENLPIDAYSFHHHDESMRAPTYVPPNRVLNQQRAEVFRRESKKWTMLCANCHCVHHGCGMTASEVLTKLPSQFLPLS